MAVTISTSAANILCNAIVDLIDNGGAGSLELQTAGALVLAQMAFSNPAFGNAAAGVATANSISADTSANNTGTASAFRIKAGTGEVVLSGSVGTTGQDINLNTTSITVGDSISITSLTVTMPLV
jgi:hypothetical protein